MPKNEPRVYAIGDNTLDVYIGDIAGSLVGGNALNVAAQLALHGVKTEYAGAVGDDAAGRQITSAIEDAGVGMRGLVTLAGPSAVTTIEVQDSGDRRFASEEFGVTAQYAPDDQVVARAVASGWVHIGMIAEASTLRARLKAADPSVIISQDCAVSEGTDNLDIAIWSVGPHLADAKEALARGLEAGLATVIVTMGPEGALVSDGRRTLRGPAHQADVVDTTGAGDSFIAGFIAARLDGVDLEAAMNRGLAWAAATCSHLGGWPQTFSAARV